MVAHASSRFLSGRTPSDLNISKKHENKQAPYSRRRIWPGWAQSNRSKNTAKPHGRLVLLRLIHHWTYTRSLSSR
jgi:hypothetical protein